MNGITEMFDVQRIWDAWPGLRHTQTLRAILRECSENDDSDSQKALNVFVVGSHLFVVTGIPENVSSSSVVYVFDMVPKSHQLSGAVDEGGAAAAKTYEGAGLSERQKVKLLSANSVVVNVVSNADSNNTILVIEQSGLAHVMQFASVEHKWNAMGQVELNPSRKLVINRIVFDKDRRTFVWCQTDSKGQDGVCTCSIHLCEVEFSTNLTVSSRGSLAILNNAPPMNLYLLKGGICLLPRTSAPPGLSLFWSFSGKKLIPYVWCHGNRMLSHLTEGLTNFRTIAVRLAALWKKGRNANQGLVAMQSRPLTGCLLAIDNEMNVYNLRLCKNYVERKHYIKLLDPIGQFQTLPLLHNQPITEQLQLVSYHSNIGILYKGSLRLYDGFCGELIYYNDDFEGVKVDRWCCSSSIEQFGLWTQQGVWIVKSKKISDYAQMLAQGLFPLTTDADEMMSPGQQLPEGQSYAARLCCAWGLHLQATKYTINIIYSKLKAAMEGDGDMPDQEIPSELMELLADTSLQSPALLVALLVQFPECRGFLKKKVKEFLSQYYLPATGVEEDGDEATTNTESFLYTPLNMQLAPLLAEYGRLADEYDLMLNSSAVQCDQLSSIGDEVKQILKRAENWVATRDGPITKLLARLESLMVSHPMEMLQTIKQYIGVENFQEASIDFSGSALCTTHNWKMLFAAESSTPTVLQCPSRIPLFEIICELLYLTQPEQLLGFVNFARVARDTQPHDDDSVFARKARKTFFYQRALDALTPCACANTISHEAVKAYCQLLLLSERPDAEVCALELLLNNELYTDAISLTSESCKQHNPGLHNLMFYKLLGHLLESGKLHQYYKSVMNVCPPSFSIFDLLSILKQKLCREARSDKEGTAIPPVLANNSKQLTVDLLLPQIYELLERAGLKR